MSANQQTSMKKFAFVILFAGGIIAAALLVMDSGPLAKLRLENKELNVKLDQLLKLEEDPRQRSNQGGQAGNKSVLPEEQFRELLRLRGEVAVLRREKEQASRPRTESRSSSGISTGQRSRPTSVPDQDYLPKESCAFVGYEDPNSALQSCLWAWNSGDPKAVAASFTSGYRARWGRKSDSEIAVQLSNNLYATRGFRILERNPVSEDTVDLTLGDEAGQHKLRMRFKRVVAEWKFDGEFKVD
jgi:hypothetical protein